MILNDFGLKILKAAQELPNMSELLQADDLYKNLNDPTPLEADFTKRIK